MVCTVKLGDTRFRVLKVFVSRRSGDYLAVFVPPFSSILASNDEIVAIAPESLYFGVDTTTAIPDDFDVHGVSWGVGPYRRLTDPETVC
jgi:hypothetical protein